jgi:hypothetical protein
MERIPHIPLDQEKIVKKAGAPDLEQDREFLKMNTVSQDPDNNLHFLRKQLTQTQITKTFDIIQSDRVAKLIGLCAHFVYWCVLGNYNEVPLDEYHMKQLFISMLQCVGMIEAKFSTNKNMKSLFINFVMPIIILTIRVQIEMMFKMHFRAFLGRVDKTKGDAHQTVCMRLINGVITEIFDPNIFYSRLSFLESGKDALDIKNNLNQGRAHNGYKLPQIKEKFYTRSALVKNLIPLPSDGKLRSKFGENRTVKYPPLTIKRAKGGSKLAHEA